MKLSDQAASHLAARARQDDQDHERMLVRVHDTAMTRKRVVYWIGFLEGALASRAIEPGEDGTILAEARRFQEFFEDPDASDLVEDLAGCCFADSADLMDQLRVAALAGGDWNVGA
ncbi:MAG: hypothetical protein ACU0AT_13170 [Tranquillimonas sp.]